MYRHNYNEYADRHFSLHARTDSPMYERGELGGVRCVGIDVESSDCSIRLRDRHREAEPQAATLARQPVPTRLT